MECAYHAAVGGAGFGEVAGALIDRQECLSYFPEVAQRFARFSFHFVLPALQSRS